MKSISLLLFVIVSALFVVSCKNPTTCLNPTSESIDDGTSAKVGEKITFENCSQDADSYVWDFGDGSSSTLESPNHAYKKGDVYTVSLIATGRGDDQVITTELEIASLDGDWEGTFSIEGTIFVFYFTIEQDENTLTGSFQFEDGTGNSKFLSSKIKGKDITIKNEIKNGTSTYSFLFSGKINDEYRRMQGDLSINNVEYGEWTANKYTSKSSHLCPDIESRTIQKLTELLP
jgi:PKD repeat protein